MAVRKADRLKRIRQLLMQRRRELLNEIQRSDLQGECGDPWPRSGDLVDRACSGAWLEQSSALAEAEAKELDAIEEALRLIEEGGYGECQRCGRPIGSARLRALPTATLCVKCREKLDGSLLESSGRPSLPQRDSPGDVDSDRLQDRRIQDRIRQLLGDDRSLFSGN